MAELSILPPQQEIPAPVCSWAEPWQVSHHVRLSNAPWGMLGLKGEVVAPHSTTQCCWACSSMQEGLFPFLLGLLFSLLGALRQGCKGKCRKLLFPDSKTS